MEQAVKASGAKVKMLMIGRGTLSKAFYQRYGREALLIIAEASSRSVVESGKAMKAMAQVKSMKDISERFKMIAAMLGMEMESMELSGGVFHYKSLPPCTMGLEGTYKELCEVLMTTDLNIISTLLQQEWI